MPEHGSRPRGASDLPLAPLDLTGVQRAALDRLWMARLNGRSTVEPQPLVTVSGGVAEVFAGDVTVVDFDDWDGEPDTQQDIIEKIQCAGYRCVVYGWPDDENPNVQIFRPDDTHYDQFINESVHDGMVFTVYDPTPRIEP